VREHGQELIASPHRIFDLPLGPLLLGDIAENPDDTDDALVAIP
jgi:hypothetical protein